MGLLSVSLSLIAIAMLTLRGRHSSGRWRPKIIATDSITEIQSGACKTQGWVTGFRQSVFFNKVYSRRGSSPGGASTSTTTSSFFNQFAHSGPIAGVQLSIFSFIDVQALL